MKKLHFASIIFFFISVFALFSCVHTTREVFEIKSDLKVSYNLGDFKTDYKATDGKLVFDSIKVTLSDDPNTYITYKDYSPDIKETFFFVSSNKEDPINSSINNNTSFTNQGFTFKNTINEYQLFVAVKKNGYLYVADEGIKIKVENVADTKTIIITIVVFLLVMITIGVYMVLVRKRKIENQKKAALQKEKEIAQALKEDDDMIKNSSLENKNSEENSTGVVNLQDKEIDDSEEVK
ncbi:MAG: hypothetical protein SPK64_03450 [Candidatus Enterosoma sp.]|nr:hypothetical protein [Bacilli bacterium]MDY5650081.1 hypothetical protein [Candidatus Enterosoma sp.]